jgi:hypothetical protein
MKRPTWNVNELSFEPSIKQTRTTANKRIDDKVRKQSDNQADNNNTKPNRQSEQAKRLLDNQGIKLTLKRQASEKRKSI